MKIIVLCVFITCVCPVVIKAQTPKTPYQLVNFLIPKRDSVIFGLREWARIVNDLSSVEDFHNLKKNRVRCENFVKELEKSVDASSAVKGSAEFIQSLHEEITLYKKELSFMALIDDARDGNTLDTYKLEEANSQIQIAFTEINPLIKILNKKIVDYYLKNKNRPQSEPEIIVMQSAISNQSATNSIITSSNKTSSSVSQKTFDKGNEKEMGMQMFFDTSLGAAFYTDFNLTEKEKRQIYELFDIHPAPNSSSEFVSEELSPGQAINFFVTVVDLNDDGNAEIFVNYSDNAPMNQMGTTVFVYKMSNGDYFKANESYNSEYQILKTKTKGYWDLMRVRPSITADHLKWDGTKYMYFKTVSFQKGKEPATWNYKELLIFQKKNHLKK